MKYRAWDIRNKKMVYDALVLSGAGQLVTVNEEYFNSPFSFFDGCVWMQLIGGFLAADQTEVYAHDIVDNNGKIQLVELELDIKTLMGQGDAITELHFKTGLWQHGGIFSFEKIKVLGNMYENPELIKLL